MWIAFAILFITMDITTYLQESGTSASALAKKLGVSPAVVYQWRAGIRQVPVRKCLEIERATAGKVTVRDLRRDWRLIWPERKPDETA